jgi:hypothetical protein
MFARTTTIKKQMIPIIRETNIQLKGLFLSCRISLPQNCSTGFVSDAIYFTSHALIAITRPIIPGCGSTGMKVNYKRYGLYLLRWQASTPLLAGVALLLTSAGPLFTAIVANLIGGLIFFWVDQFIFTSQSLAAQWEVKDNIACVDCHKTARGYRLVRSGDYDRTHDHEPEFRCEECSRKKAEELKERGVKTE